MGTVLNSVNEKTKIVGENRMQLLLFTLANLDQRFGINVFKVREVLKCPKLTRVMGSNKAIRGMTNIRGETVPVIDLAASIGFEETNMENSMLILTEYNNSIQGFAVDSVQNIQNVSWEQVEDAPETLGNDHHLTAVVNLPNELINIIDVEDVLSKISPKFAKYAKDDYDTGLSNIEKEGLHKRILILDDSVVARKQLSKAIKDLGFQVDEFKNGQQALEHVNEILKKNKNLNEVYDLIISDIEMPKMDGYTFVSKMRELRQDIKIILHTSLSGVFNKQLVEKVGADSFIPKFEPKTLGEEIEKLLEIK
tara:strand:- start:2459 stop:3385 length:927 start_codon:yes stop_codon:yes gene_type:complete